MKRLVCFLQFVILLFLTCNAALEDDVAPKRPGGYDHGLESRVDGQPNKALDKFGGKVYTYGEYHDVALDQGAKRVLLSKDADKMIRQQVLMPDMGGMAYLRYMDVYLYRPWMKQNEQKTGTNGIMDINAAAEAAWIAPAHHADQQDDEDMAEPESGYIIGTINIVVKNAEQHLEMNETGFADAPEFSYRGDIEP